MKKQNKSKPKAVKELASQFEEELNKSLPISVLPDGSISYKEFNIKRNDIGNWVIYNKNSRVIIEEFYLKTTALMAAKAYSKVNLNKFFEIKHLDNKYWASYSDNQIYKHNIKKAKDYEKYLVLLNRIEHSQERADYFKDKISTMFKWSFV